MNSAGKSAGSDIKRLQDMVKRLEEQNAQLKSTDYSLNRRPPNNRVMGDGNIVKVKLNLDDVPLLDLNAMVEGDEDTWLYVSPKHPPSVEQKKISPFKYLKDSLDVPELNKVRGSLLAKLESIAAQEEALSGSPPHEDHHHHHHHHRRHSEHSRPSHDSSLKSSVQLSDDDDSDNIQVKPRRRVPSVTTSSQDDSDLVVKGPLRRRGGPFKAVTSLNQSPRPVNDDEDDSDDDSITHRPQRRVPAVPTFQPSSQDDPSLVARGTLKRRGPSPQPRVSLDAVSYVDGDDDNDFDPQERPQRRGPVPQDYEDLVVKGPLRRRGGTPQPRQPVAAGPVKRRGESPQPRGSSDAVSYVDGDDDNDFAPQERPQRRGPVPQEYEDLVVKGPLKRRGGTPRPRLPLAAGYGLVDNDEEYKEVQPRRRGPSPASSQEDYNSSWQRDELRSDADVPVVTAVRRREPNQVRRREPPQPRTAEDTDVRRRSLPPAPTYSRGVGSRQSNTLPHSPAHRKSVTPRTGQLAAPRRIPTPRGASPARSNDDSWSEGFY